MPSVSRSRLRRPLTAPIIGRHAYRTSYVSYQHDGRLLSAQLRAYFGRLEVELTQVVIAEEPSVKVTVAAWTQINHEGQVHRGGESFSASASLADSWVRFGWALKAGK
jgi:hypothetical protein